MQNPGWSQERRDRSLWFMDTICVLFLQKKKKKDPQTVPGWKLLHFKAGSGPSASSHSTFCWSCSLCCLCCCVSSRCVFDVSAVSVISPSFSRFMVSPRKKYSFRSVILNAVKKKKKKTQLIIITCNLLFTVPLLWGLSFDDLARSLGTVAEC